MNTIIKLKHAVFLGVLFLFVANLLEAQTKPSTERIHLNQIGFYPMGAKVAIVVTDQPASFCIMSTMNAKDTLFKGKLVDAGVWEPSGEHVFKADFSAFTQSGIYTLYVSGVGVSYPFEIKAKVNKNVAYASLKMYYYQRASTKLESEYVGKFAREAGHQDVQVLVHNSAATAQIPAGTKIRSPRGWYDAGDYNKYIVNSGISTYTLLALYEDFPVYANALKLNIPESNNAIPDLIDEINWNLRWMLTMQDPNDGGVYHKLTNANFDGSVKPVDAITPRYVVQKTTTATLDFAAVMAQASRIYKNFEKEMPGLADSCLLASKKAYAWAKLNPSILYIQSALKDPAITTGAYDDNNVSDEFFWAASELFIATGDPTYFADANLDKLAAQMLCIPDWQNVGTLGIYSLLRSSTFDKFSSNKNVSHSLASLKLKFLDFAKDLQKKANASAYAVPMGSYSNDFVWGSNAVAGNESVLLIKAYLLSKDTKLLDAAIDNVDYLLGRNAVGYCFVTGFGDKSPLNPHHRLSESDGIVEPIPGLVVGGPNPGQQDLVHCPNKKYPSNLPALSYIDEQCSYASNEIAINWNAPFAYSVNALESLK